MTGHDIERAFAQLGDVRKAVQRPAAERLAEAALARPALRERIAALLRSPDARERWGAAYALARLEPAPLDAIPVLFDCLGADDGDLRWAAARLVVRAVSAVPALGPGVLGLVTAASARRRKMALYCLRDLAGVVAVDADRIAAALRDADGSVRMAAMSALLALLPRTSATADLLVPLLDDGEPGVRRTAAATLAQLGVETPPIRSALAQACASDDAVLARVAASALSRLDDPAPRPPRPRPA